MSAPPAAARRLRRDDGLIRLYRRTSTCTRVKRPKASLATGTADGAGSSPGAKRRCAGRLSVDRSACSTSADTNHPAAGSHDSLRVSIRTEAVALTSTPSPASGCGRQDSALRKSAGGLPAGIVRCRSRAISSVPDQGEPGRRSAAYPAHPCRSKWSRKSRFRKKVERLFSRSVTCRSSMASTSECPRTPTRSAPARPTACSARTAYPQRVGPSRAPLSVR